VYSGSNERLLVLSDNIHLDTHWAVRVVDLQDKRVDKDFYADYFDFPRSQTGTSQTVGEWEWPRIKVQKIKAKQNIGVTQCSNKDIEEKRLYHLLIAIYHSTNITISEGPQRIVGNAPFPLLAQPTILYLPCVADP
jgi:hypothetical protein